VPLLTDVEREAVLGNSIRPDGEIQHLHSEASTFREKVKYIMCVS
jgi:hypothetical protein